MKFVAVTSCPTGIAHTYMAAEALELAAEDAGHVIAVETQGAAGSKPLSPQTIAEADAVIFAADVEVRNRERFDGKPVVTRSVKKAISDAPGMIADAVAAAENAPAPGSAAAAAAATLSTKVEQGAGFGTRLRQWLMTGVSYMIPFVAAGGILIALGFMVAQFADGSDGVVAVTSIPISHLLNDFSILSGMDWAALLFQTGALAFGFLVPILSGFIAYAIADR